jgi:hypothetical protein
LVVERVALPLPRQLVGRGGERAGARFARQQREDFLHECRPEPRKLRDDFGAAFVV